MTPGDRPIPYHSVSMIRRHLDGVPQHAFPPPYTLRPYQPGDRAVWLDVHHQCYDAEGRITIDPELYVKNFGTDEQVLAERQLFVFDRGNQPVGSLTAWWNDDYHGERFGQIHWVAIVPDDQGRGLAKPLLSAGLARLRALGHHNAWLGTQTTRVPAISLYLQFGFEPDIRTADDRAKWGVLRGIIRHPALDGLGG
ncbi:GNAT family N-acetyltransferase [bacterium]|nr:GNAT family N-acetyltransferase [bacterium]